MDQDLEARLGDEVVVASSGRVTFGAGLPPTPQPVQIIPFPDWFVAVEPIEAVAITTDNAPPPWLLPSRVERAPQCQQQHRVPPPICILGRPRPRRRRDRPTRCGGCSGARTGAADDGGDQPQPGGAPSTFVVLTMLTPGMDPAQRWELFDSLPEAVRERAWSEVASTSRLAWDA